MDARWHFVCWRQGCGAEARVPRGAQERAGGGCNRRRSSRGSRKVRGGARVIPSPTWWVRGQSGYTQAGATRDGHESHTSICISCQTHRGMRTHARMCVRVFFCITTQTGHVRLIPQNPFKRDPVVSVARGSSLCQAAPRLDFVRYLFETLYGTTSATLLKALEPYYCWATRLPSHVEAITEPPPFITVTGSIARGS